MLNVEMTKHDWQFYTDADTDEKAYCRAQSGRGCFWPRGKMLGGSSGMHLVFI